MNIRGSRIAPDRLPAFPTPGLPPARPVANHPRHPPTARAFSLVEITLAIGIISFALLAVFGLLPVAIDASRESAKDTVFAALTVRVVSDIRSRGYEWLTNASATPAHSTVWPYTFDSEGRPVAANAASRAYVCNVVQGNATNASSLTATTSTIPGTGSPVPRLEFQIELRHPATAPAASQDVRRIPMIVAEYE